VESNVHFCLSEREDTDEFKYLYESGYFGIFVEKYTANFTQTTRRVAKQIKQEPSLAVEKLGLTAHYETFTAVLGALPLKEEHRAKLEARGMSDAAIAKGKYFSLTQKQKVEGATKYFPGFNQHGVYTNPSGIAIPALDFNGHILGFQIMPDEVVSGAKYKWTTHKEFGSDVPLNNAKLVWEGNLELPLGMCLSYYKKGDRLYLAEGLLKPAIAASNLNINVLGAAGGLFKQSPKQLKFYLDALQPAVVIWLADTGSANNAHVWANINKQATHIAALGYEFKVADWGQLTATKESRLDCDEISLDFWASPGAHIGADNSRDSGNPTRRVLVRSVRDCGAVALQAHASSQSQQILRRIYKGFGRLTASVKAKLQPKPSYIKKAASVNFLGGAAIAKKNRGLVHTFKPQDRQKVIAKLIESGQKYVLDSSDMGSGKSYVTGTYKASDFTTNMLETPSKLWYLSKQHRSPSTPTLENNFVQYPTKHGGLYSHPSKLTPSGKPIFMRERLEGSRYTIDSNCSYYEKQAALIKANSTVSLCRKCPLKAQCSKEFEPGSHGYLFQQNTILKNYTEISANLKGLNPNLINNSDVAFIDEASQSIPFTKDVIVSIGQLEAAEPRFKQILGKNFSLLAPLFTLAKEGTENFYGQTLAEYLEINGGIQPVLLHAASAIATVEALINEQRAEDHLAPILEFGRYLFLALSGLDHTVSATITKGKITLTVRNEDAIEHLNQFNTVFFMDATMTQKDLALRLGCAEEDILVIAQESPQDAYQNVVVFQNQALGTMGAIRSEKVQQNSQLIRQSLEHKYAGQIGVIDKKAYSQKGNLDHFSDARGSNAFEDKKALAIMGMANMNLNAAKAEFEVIHNLQCNAQHEDLFKTFYTAKQQAETLQEIGRLRATRRLDEQLDVHIVATADLGFLAEHGIKVVQVSGGEFDESLDNNYDRLIKRLIKLKDEGCDFSKLSIRKIANLVDMPKSTMYDQIMSNVVEIESDLPCGEKVERLLAQILDDPVLLLYYTGKVLAAAGDPNTRKELVATSLKILALVKEGIKEELKKQSTLAERVIKLADELGVELNALNIINLERKLS
jgi:hypothetical protein